MRFTGWRARAPQKESLTPKVEAAIKPALVALGGEADPETWIVWGDDPTARYTLLALSPAGLIIVAVRVNVPQEGPRTSAKLVRWDRVQTGELAMDVAGGHRHVSFQVEGQIMRGSDTDADDISAFALEVFAGIDGRPRARPQGSRS